MAGRDAEVAGNNHDLYPLVHVPTPISDLSSGRSPTPGPTVRPSTKRTEREADFRRLLADLPETRSTPSTASYPGAPLPVRVDGLERPRRSTRPVNLS